MHAIWWNTIANGLQLAGALCLLAEWIWAFRSPPFLLLHDAIYSEPDDLPDAENVRLERSWNRMRQGRRLLAGVGYALLSVGLLVACRQSWGT